MLLSTTNVAGGMQDYDVIKLPKFAVGRSAPRPSVRREGGFFVPATLGARPLNDLFSVVAITRSP
jgi:hypothetical protein